MMHFQIAAVLLLLTIPLSAQSFYPREIDVFAPVARKDPARITVCLNAPSPDCDYDSPSSEVLQFPVKGKATYYGTIDAKDGKALNGIANIQVRTGSLLCSISSAIFFEHAQASGDTLTWNLDPAVFGQGCFVPEQALFAMSVKVFVNGAPVSLFVNNSGSTPPQNTYKLPPMFIRQGPIVAPKRRR